MNTSRDRLRYAVACKAAREKYIKALRNLGGLAAEYPQEETIDACKDEVNWLDSDLREVRLLFSAANVLTAK